VTGDDDPTLQVVLLAQRALPEANGFRVGERRELVEEKDLVVDASNVIRRSLGAECGPSGE
jgi:hypothetical protein